MSTHNIGFYGELTKIILQLSPHTLLIYSSGQTSIDALFAILSAPFGHIYRQQNHFVHILEKLKQLFQVSQF